MVLSFVNASYTSGDYTFGGGGGNTTMSVPSGIRSGDLLVMAVNWAVGETGHDSLVPAGWTLLANSGSVTNSREMVCAKIATGTESVVTIIGSSIDYWLGSIVAYRGGRVPTQVTGVWIDQDSTSRGIEPLPLPAITVPNPSPLLIYGFVYSPATFVAPPGYVVDSQGTISAWGSTVCWMRSTGLVSGRIAPTVDAGYYAGAWWGQAMVVGAGGGLTLLV